MKRASFFILFLILIPLLIISCSRGDTGGRYPVVGVDGVKDIYIFEDHSEALVHWMKRGYKDCILINVDQHDDLRYIPEYKIQRLKELVKNRQWDEIANSHDRGVPSLFTLADFIFAAYRLGVINKLYWVSPSGLLKWPDIQKGAQELLRAFGYPGEIIKTFKADGRVAEGRIYGLDVVLTSVENLPELDEPVLITFDVDYFSNSLWKLKTGELDIFSRFFSMLKKKRLHAKDVTIAYSVNGGYTEPIYRYLGDELKQLLGKPGIAVDRNYPELWRIRDRGFRYFRKKGYEESLVVFDEGLKRYPDEPSLLGGKAAVLTMMGRYDEALINIEKAVEVEPEYAYLYVFLGRSLGQQGRIKEARRYLDVYLKIDPGSYYALITYGNVLYDNANDNEAFEYYSRILSMYEDVNALMYAGDALFHLRRFQDAKIYYHRGLTLLNEIGYRSLRNYPESVRNMRYLGLL